MIDSYILFPGYKNTQLCIERPAYRNQNWFDYIRGECNRTVESQGRVPDRDGNLTTIKYFSTRGRCVWLG